MELNNFTLEEGDLVALTQCKDSAPAIAILKIAKQMYDKEVKKMADGLAGVNDAEPKKDFRHCIGSAHVAEFIVRLPKEAEALMSGK